MTKAGSQLLSHAAAQHRERTEFQEAGSAIFTITIRYKGEEHVTELPLTKAVIGRLALEADLHHVKIDELVSKLVINTMKKGLLQLVLRKPRRSGSNLT